MASPARKCAACGSVDLTCGRPCSYRGAGVGFKAQGRFGPPVGTAVYACLTCGHLSWGITEKGLADLRDARTVDVAGQVAGELRTMAETDDMLREIQSRVREGSPSIDESPPAPPEREC